MLIRLVQWRLVALHHRIARRQLQLRLLRSVKYELLLQLEGLQLARDVSSFAKRLELEREQNISEC